MEIISRKAAHIAGLLRYFTGKECKHGHITERLTSNATCLACVANKKAEQGSRALANKAKRERRLNDPEPIRAQERSKRLRNPEVYRKRDRERWVNGKAQTTAAWLKADRIARPWIYAERARRRKAAVKRATPKWLSQQQRKEIVAFYKKAYSMSQETGEKHHVDHIIPLNGVGICGLHVPWNLQVITATDNLKKGNRL